MFLLRRLTQNFAQPLVPQKTLPFSIGWVVKDLRWAKNQLGAQCAGHASPSGRPHEIVEV